MIISLLGVFLAFLGITFWMWMLADCATKESDQGNDRLIWTLIILIANIFGALLYWIVRRPLRQAESDRRVSREPENG